MAAEITQALPDGADLPVELTEKRHRWREGHTVVALRIAVVGVLIGLWQLMSGPVLPQYAVSQPSQVAVALWDLITSSAGWSDIRTTAFEIVLGFILGVALGTALALVLG